MDISLSGKGAGNFSEELDAAGIKYTKFQPRPGMIMAAAGDILRIAQDAGPCAALAVVLIAWVRATGTRSITITTADYKVVHAKAYSVNDLETLLGNTNRIILTDTATPELQSQQ
jgi:hypothetical protein